jgi:flagellum-specific peptidoglycan hydrolase FlgJ
MDALTFFAIARNHARVYNAFGVAVQAVLETGWFHSPLCRIYHNYGGIKCRDFWLKAGRTCAPMPSPEEIKGRMVTVNSQFRVYFGPDDYLECLNDKFREPGTNYSAVMANADCFWGHYAGLKYGGWATDSKYFMKLCDLTIELAPDLLGAGWKQRLVAAFQLIRSRRILEVWMDREISRRLEAIT